MVICQKDIAALERAGGVSTKPPPSTRRPLHYLEDQGTTSKSCLVLPSFGNKKSSRRRISSSAASTADQSSHADPFLVTASDDSKGLLQSSNQTPNNVADWYIDTTVEEESSSPPIAVTPSPQQQQQPASLLSFPPIRDRSHDARRRQHWSAYKGEMEPQGKRGQEAKFRNVPPSNPTIPLRQFAQKANSGTNTNTVSQDGVGMKMRMMPESKPPTRQTPPEKPPVQQQQQQQQPPRIVNDSTSIGSESSETTTGSEIFKNNAQEIAQQEAIPYSLKTESSSYDQQQQQQPPQDDSSMLQFRKSAPVDVDDSSFQDPAENVQGIHAMAMEHVLRGEYDMALQAFSQVLQVYLEKYGRAHPLTASAYHNLGTVHSKRAGLLLEHTLHQRHCREQALLCFQAAARAARDAPQLGPNHPNVAVSLVRIGFLLLQSRQYQNAVITFQEALRIRSQHYSKQHALVANLYNNLGVCHMHLQEFLVGRKYLQQALDIQKQLLAQDEFSTTALLELADTLCNIGGLCLEWIRQQGPDARHALDAESAFLEALEVRTKVLGKHHALTNQVRSLHDMVRSIPLPKMSSSSSSERQRSRSPAGRRPSPGRQRSPYPSSYASASHTSSISASPTSAAASPGRPYATARTTPSPRRQQQHPSSLSRSGRGTPERLHMPSLVVENAATIATRPRPEEDYDEKSPTKSLVLTTTLANSPANTTLKSISPMDKSAQSELGSTFTSMDERLHDDATEESCLLSGFVVVDDDIGQISTVVSFAQTAASCQKASERNAVLNQAKTILDLHKNFLDSPQVSLDLTRSNHQYPRSIVERPPIINEDGLASLGGTWPESSQERITPEVLEHPEQHLNTLQKCAVNYMKRGRFHEALHLFEMVLDCQREKNGRLHEDVGAALHNVGIAHLRMEDHYKAIQAFEEAARVRKGALGRDHPQVAVSLVKVGISLLLLKRYEDSLWIFREALTVRKNALGSLHPSTARIYNNIGCVHVEFQELKEARRAFEAALDIQRNALVHEPDSGPLLFGAATTLQNIGYLYRKRNLQEKAAVVLTEALNVSDCVCRAIDLAKMFF